MGMDKTQARQRIRELAQSMLPAGDFTGFFEAVYETANGDTSNIPWADLQPHPISLAWLQQQHRQGQGKRALVVGCGLGDDAEDLAGRGYQVTAFDVSPRAIEWCKQRFPDSPVNYQTADLFNAPANWQQAFDFVLEIYTIQALPVALRDQAIQNIASFVAPTGQLLVVCRGRTSQEDPGTLPWPLTREELSTFTQTGGLHQISFEEPTEEGQRHFRVLYEREG